MLQPLKKTTEIDQSEACDLSLLNIALKVQEERPLDEIIYFAGESIRAIFGIQLLWIGLKKPASFVKLYICGKNSAEYLAGITLHWDNSLEGQGPTGNAIRTGRFQLMNIQDPRLQLWREKLSKYGVTSGAAFPLKVGGIILGALTIYTKNPEFWSKRTLVHLSNFAEQIALAIHLTANRQRLKLLTTGLESAANAIVITTRQGNIEWVNSAFLKLHGYTAGEAENLAIGTLRTSQHPPGFYRSILQHIAKGRIWQGEITNRRKDGTHYISETTITPVRDETGTITNFIAIIQDITRRKQTETEMAEAREAIIQAERLNALGTMAAGIAHEINQPLNSLKVFVDGMLYWHKQGKILEINDVMDSLQEVSKQAERIDAIIKHMRAFIHGADKLTPCSVNNAVEESLTLVGSQLLAHNITVTTELTADLPPILGNCTQLEQIIINLLINAMHSLDSTGAAVKQIEIATGREGQQILLSIKDNGAGIRAEHRQQIFDPFFTTKFAGEGMGLGLSIVHSIVTSYGGRIKVQDNPEAGVTFRLEFPAANC